MRSLINKIIKPYGYEIKRIGRAIGILKSLARKQERIKFLQIGANDGVSFDDIYSFIVGHNCEGVVVEPLKYFFDRLSLNYLAYPKVKPLQVAIHPSESNFAIYSVKQSKLSNYPHWACGIASFNRGHLINLGVKEDDIEKQVVPCIHLMELIRDNDLFDLDYLQVDTEGFDAEIIRMLDFSRCKPSIIKFESGAMSKETKSDILRLLKSNGYKFYEEKRDVVAFRK